MPSTLSAPSVRSDPPAIREIPADRPFYWLAAGVRDLARDPFSSLAWGILFAMAGDLILLLALPHPHLFSLAVSGFFLVAPLLAAGLYEISRRHERNEPVSYALSLSPWRRNGQSLALFGLFLAILVIVWERITAVLFALTIDGVDRVDRVFVAQVFLSTEHLGFLVPWLALGGALAALVFALGAITSPLLIDRRVDLATAMYTSLKATLANPLTLAIWGALIVALTLIGFATLLFGLIFIMPVLGHASWHAYRDLVE